MSSAHICLPNNDQTTKIPSGWVLGAVLPTEGKMQAGPPRDSRLSRGECCGQTCGGRKMQVEFTYPNAQTRLKMRRRDMEKLSKKSHVVQLGRNRIDSSLYRASQLGFCLNARVAPDQWAFRDSSLGIWNGPKSICFSLGGFLASYFLSVVWCSINMKAFTVGTGYFSKDIKDSFLYFYFFLF